jgi:drug/metabolite transporter (DMT)-like permease
VINCCVALSYEYLALLAAACWAVGSLMSATASTHLGAFAFTRWRMLCAALMLWLIALTTGGWATLAASSLGLLALSGIVGIFIGDTALFAAMNRLGPRRAGVLFATHSVFSVVLAYFFLGETQWGWTLAGSSLLISGVMIAIFFGKRKTELHAWEANQSQLKSGVALGLLAALCQAVATLMLKPLMESSIDAVSASAVRMSTAFVLHQVIFLLGFKVARAYLPMNKKVFLLVLANAALSMVLGMTLILQALKHGDAGMVAILSSVSPVMVLPLLWLVYKRSPALGAWLGASLTVLGTVLILLKN